MPGVGTLAGGLGGALLGHSIEEMAKGEDPYAVNRYAWNWDEYGGQANRAESVRNQQTRLAEELWRRQQGLAPSVAEAQYKQAQQQALAGTTSLARSARGGALGQAAAMQSAMQARAQQQQQAAAYGAQLRAQEQMNAEQGLGQLYGQQRGQDITGQQMALERQKAMGQQQLGEERIAAGSYDQAAGREQQNKAGMMQMGSSMLGGLLSDERMKRDVHPLEPGQMEAFLDDLAAYWYRYKRGSGEDPGPRHGGVMAQDVGDSDLGAALVRSRGDGAMEIDKGGALAAALAGLGNLHDRVARLEGGGE